MGTVKYASPVGEILISANGGFVTELIFNTIGNYCANNGQNAHAPKSQLLLQKLDELTPTPDDAVVLRKLTEELDAYFAGKLRKFTVPLKAKGTPFRKKVWDALLTIPYGETISYKELARRIDNPKAIRAVGGANHHNPISIIIPCHRVIGANGKLVGYGGGMDVKEFLLEHEKRV